MYHYQSFVAVMLFAFVHLFAQHAQRFNYDFRRRFLSIGSGIAIAYVFIDIMPKISKFERIVNSAIKPLFPYFERHVYVMALCGFLLFFIVDRSKNLLDNKPAFLYLTIGSYALFNLFIGYAVADADNPEVRPLVLFTIAIGLHYFANDYSLSETLGSAYDHAAKWILVSFLIFGWLLGFVFELHPAAVGLISAFIGGGVIMNVTRHELPEMRPHSLSAFLLAAAGYTVILLMIG